MEERILTTSISDKEQIRNPFHYKNSITEEQGEVLLCVHYREMFNSESKAIA